MLNLFYQSSNQGFINGQNKIPNIQIAHQFFAFRSSDNHFATEAIKGPSSSSTRNGLKVLKVQTHISGR